MRKTTAARRLAVLKGAAVAGVLATAAVATGSASAQVFVITAGSGAAANGSTLATDITQANTNGGSNTIIISSGLFAPTTQLPTITDPNLTITANHALQSVSGQGPIISGSGDTADQPLLVIGSGGGLTVEGVDFRGIGVANGVSPAIDDAGRLTAYSSAFQANPAEATILVDSTGTATLVESLVSDGLGFGIDNEAGTVNLTNATVARQVGGINDNGTTNANNTILASNAGTVGATNCTVPLSTSGNDVDTDGSCIAAGDTSSRTGTTAAPLAQTLGQTRSNGGPTVSIAIPTTSASNPALGLGNALMCSLTDQRFFVHTGSGCDAGAYQSNGTQDTTPVSCPGPGTIIKNAGGQNTQQIITVTDPLSGLGPEGGAVGDLSDSQASLTLGNDQADVVDGATITNGTVSLGATSSSGPSTGGVQVTATKTTLGTPSQWSFTATNWAGVTKLCS